MSFEGLKDSGVECSDEEVLWLFGVLSRGNVTVDFSVVKETLLQLE